MAEQTWGQWFASFFGSDVQQQVENIDDPTGVIGNPLPKDFTLNQSEYDFTYRVFPSDIGEQSDHSHYMIININVPNKSTYDSINGVQLFNRLENELSKTDTLRYNLDPLYYDAKGTPQGIVGNITRPRFTRRIKESIVLYIPDTMQFVQNNIFEDVSLTAISGDVAKMGVTTSASFLGGVASQMFGSTIANAIEGIGNQISTAIDSTGSPGGVVNRAAAFVGTPINPKIEVLFRNTPQREFDFMFFFAPESEEESKAMYQIIKTLRFHAAPEIDAKSGGFTLTPPSEFDITFYNKGVENTAVPRINTCVLENITVDYAPSGVGWQTFSNGHPVTCRMTMKFRETEVISKLRVSQGF
jgi:hypothetical protein